MYLKCTNRTPLHFPWTNHLIYFTVILSAIYMNISTMEWNKIFVKLYMLILLLLIAILNITKNVRFSTSHNNFVILFLMILAKFFLILHFYASFYFINRFWREKKIWVVIFSWKESMTAMVIEDHIFKIALFLKYLSLYDLIKTIGCLNKKYLEGFLGKAG